jgi:hypothetical protein
MGLTPWLFRGAGRRHEPIVCPTLGQDRPAHGLWDAFTIALCDVF